MMWKKIDKVEVYRMNIVIKKDWEGLKSGIGSLNEVDWILKIGVEDMKKKNWKSYEGIWKGWGNLRSNKERIDIKRWIKLKGKEEKV